MRRHRILVSPQGSSMAVINTGYSVKVLQKCRIGAVYFSTTFHFTYVLSPRDALTLRSIHKINCIITELPNQYAERIIKVKVYYEKVY